MKNKILIILTFLFCVISLTACDFNKVSSIVNNIQTQTNSTTQVVTPTTKAQTTKGKDTTKAPTTKSTEQVTTQETRNLEAIDNEELKKEILSEADNDLALKQYIEAINNSEVSKEELTVSEKEIKDAINNIFNSINIPATKGSVVITEDGDQESYAAYLWQEDSKIYYCEYLDDPDYNQYCDSYNIDLTQIKDRYLSDENISLLASLLDVQSIDDAIEAYGGEEASSIYALLKDFKIDETWFNADAEIENLYHLNVEAMLNSIFTEDVGKIYYAMYEEYISNVCTVAPDLYFTYINGKVRTIGINAEFNIPESIIDEDYTYISNTVVSVDALMELHYQEDKLSKIDYDVTALIKQTTTSTILSLTEGNQTINVIDANFNFAGYLDLVNYSFNISGKQSIEGTGMTSTETYKSDVYKSTYTIEEDITISKEGIKGTVSYNNLEDNVDTSIYVNADLKVNSNLELSGGFEFSETIKDKVEPTVQRGIKFNVESNVTVAEFALNDKENSVCINERVYSFLDEYITPILKGNKISIESITYDENETDPDSNVIEEMKGDIYYYINGTTIYVGLVDKNSFVDDITVYSLDVMELYNFIMSDEIKGQLEGIGLDEVEDIKEEALENELVLTILNYFKENIDEETITEEEIIEVGYDFTKIMNFFTQDENDPTIYYFSLEKAIKEIYGDEESKVLLTYANAITSTIVNKEGENSLAIKIDKENPENIKVTLKFDLLFDEFNLSGLILDGSIKGTVTLGYDNESSVTETEDQYIVNTDIDLSLSLDLEFNLQVESVVIDDEEGEEIEGKEIEDEEIGKEEINKEEDLIIKENEEEDDEFEIEDDEEEYIIEEENINMSLEGYIKGTIKFSILNESFNASVSGSTEITFIDNNANYISYIKAEGEAQLTDGFVFAEFKIENSQSYTDIETEEVVLISCDEIVVELGFSFDGSSSVKGYDNNAVITLITYYPFEEVNTKQIITISLTKGVNIDKEVIKGFNNAYSLNDIIESAIKEYLYDEPEPIIIENVIYFEDYDDCLNQVCDLGIYEISEYELVDDEDGIIQYFNGYYIEDEKTNVIFFYELEDETAAYNFYDKLLNDNETPYSEDVVLYQSGNYVYYFTYGGFIDFIAEDYEIDDDFYEDIKIEDDYIKDIE